MKVVLFANTDWYLFNFRLSLAMTLKKSGYDVLLISPPGEFGKRLIDAGLRWEAIPMDRKSLNPVKELLLLFYLARFYCREQPDLVHHFTIKCVVYGSIAAAISRVQARVNAVTGMGYVFTNTALKARLLRPFVRLLMRCVLNNNSTRLILQNSDDITSFRQARVLDGDKICLIKGSGVDLSRFKPALKLVLLGHQTRVLVAARLLWDKGIGEYIKAAQQLRRKGLPIRFLLAGVPDFGNPAAIPQSQLEAWVLEGVIELLGQVEDMPALYANVDMVVLPSYREGLPKSIIEAAACALPIVTTDVPGCREVVTDGVDGLLVPVKDSIALADAIQRLYQKPEWARQLGKSARARVLEEFDERIVIKKTLDVYQQLLGDQSLVS